MQSYGIHTRFRTVRLALAALTLAVVGAFATASPALGHDELVATDPSPDAVLAELPAELTLTFSSEIADDEGANEVQVTDAAGTDLAAGLPSAHDNILTLPLAGDPVGAVTVLWKVVSSDGHPISGEFEFTVEGPEPTETPIATLTATPSASPTASETPTATASETPVPVETDGAAAWPWIIAGVFAVGLAAAVTYLVVSRRRQQAALDEARGGASDSSAGR